MINKNFMVVAAIPFFLSGCVIAVDADDTNHHDLTILHQVGDEAQAQRQAARECARRGDEAKLVEVDMTDDENIVRSVFECD